MEVIILISNIHIISIICTLLLVTSIGVYSIRKIKSASDFAVGNRSIGSTLIAGIIIGTLVGGSSTVGTVQLAYQYGFSAWWFNLGGGIACLLLGLFLAKPLRQSNACTVPGFLAQHYGNKSQVFSSIFSSIGIFLSIVSQVLSAVAILTAMFDVTPLGAACISVLLVISYVIFGGVWGTSFVGTVKTFLLYISMIIIGLLAYKLEGGITGFQTKFPSYPWFSLFGRGLSVDVAAVFSMLVGVLSTQTYLQAMFSGKDIQASRRGALISGLLIPPLGFAGVLAGLYMKSSFPNIIPSEALPLFVLHHLPDWLGGIILATLLISTVGCAAGLVLGISTMFSQDIYKKYIAPQADDKTILLFSRIVIISVSTLTLFFVTNNLNSLILQWTFLSMGLRGSTICLPLLFVIFHKNFVNPKAGTLAIALAPCATILWSLVGWNTIDPLYIGLLISLLTLILGSIIINYLENKHLNDTASYK